MSSYSLLLVQNLIHFLRFLPPVLVRKSRFPLPAFGFLLDEFSFTFPALPDFFFFCFCTFPPLTPLEFLFADSLKRPNDAVDTSAT